MLALPHTGDITSTPYALANGLLTLHEQDHEDAKQRVDVGLTVLSKETARETGCLSPPSPVNRTEHWRYAFTVYQCRVGANGELASSLDPGKKYILRLASEDLGVKRWTYSHREQFVDDDEKPSQDSVAVKLVNCKSTAGNATFTVVKSLPWPQRMETRTRLCPSAPSFDSTLANAELSCRTALEVSLINTASEPVTVQTRGHQRFLTP